MAKAERIKNLANSAPNRTNAHIIIQTRLAEMYHWDAYVDDPYRVEDLHNLRIAAKRLRYTLELFAEVLPGEIETLTRLVAQIQEKLGTLHDGDVMIALLRLCLGSLDSGSGYGYALVEATRIEKKGRFVVNPALISQLLDPAALPSARQRLGLELLLNSVQRERESLYNDFRKYWYELKSSNFQGKVLALLAG